MSENTQPEIVISKLEVLQFLDYFIRSNGMSNKIMPIQKFKEEIASKFPSANLALDRTTKLLDDIGSVFYKYQSSDYNQYEKAYDYYTESKDIRKMDEHVYHASYLKANIENNRYGYGNYSNYYTTLLRIAGSTDLSHYYIEYRDMMSKLTSMEKMEFMIESMHDSLEYINVENVSDMQILRELISLINIELLPTTKTVLSELYGNSKAVDTRVQNIREDEVFKGNYIPLGKKITTKILLNKVQQHKDTVFYQMHDRVYSIRSVILNLILEELKVSSKKYDIEKLSYSIIEPSSFSPENLPINNYVESKLYSSICGYAKDMTTNIDSVISDFLERVFSSGYRASNFRCKFNASHDRLISFINIHSVEESLLMMHYAGINLSDLIYIAPPVNLYDEIHDLQTYEDMLIRLKDLGFNLHVEKKNSKRLMSNMNNRRIVTNILVNAAKLQLFKRHLLNHNKETPSFNSFFKNSSVSVATVNNYARGSFGMKDITIAEINKYLPEEYKLSYL